MKRKALIMAVLTTILWSGSYILNKLAFLDGVGPLTLSGLRYFFASLFLLCIVNHNSKQKSSSTLPLSLLVLLGFLGFAVAQGLQYVGQSYLNPTQSSLFLSVGNTLMVMLFDRLWLRENQTRGDLLKFLFLIAGISLYYYPWGDSRLSIVGMIFMLLSSVGYALHMTLIRRIVTAKQISTKTLVAKPMLIGSLFILIAGLAVEGLPVITSKLVLILAYLSLVSGALGFYLWTWSQKQLTAFESSSINNLMLIEIALMDFLLFSRTFSMLQILTILIVFSSVVLIQRRNAPVKKPVHSNTTE